VKFSYIALNHEHKKLTGVVSGEDEKEAREKLHNLRLSIIVLTRTSDDASETGIQTETGEEGILTFIFEALDTKGKNVKGTIDAESRKTAFYRLLSEYNFEILSLCDTKVPLEERGEKGKQGLEELAFEIEAEFGAVQYDPLDDFLFDTKTERSDEFLNARNELIENVEEIVERAKQVLEEFEEEINADEYRTIKMKIESLMRLRLSNNLKYIQDLANELLTFIDSVVRKHVESSSDDLEVHSPMNIAEKEENISGHLRVLSQVKGISERMGTLLGVTKKTSHFRKKKKRREGMEKNMAPSRFGLFLRVVKKMFWSLKRILFTRSAAVRRQHLGKIYEYFEDIYRIFQTPIKKLPLMERKIDIEETKQQEKQVMEGVFMKKYQKTAFHQFLQEIHLFFGWLLAFYIIYFYISSFVLIKWGTEFPFFSFLQSSLTNSFPFLMTGILFVLFFGMTLALRFSYGRVLFSLLYLLITVSCIFLFLFNF
jgi:hypothetical protein